MTGPRHISEILPGVLNQIEARRFEAECRYWLKTTQGKPEAVDELMDRIRKKRGAAAAQKLRDGMRAEYRKQRGGE